MSVEEMMVVVVVKFVCTWNIMNTTLDSWDVG